MDVSSLGRPLVPTEISAMILPISGLRADLAEIDENLIRNELSEMESDEHLLRRKEIYEAIYQPEKPVHESRNPGPGRGNQKTDAKLASVSFAEDTASKTGSSVRSIQRGIQIAKNITEPVKEMIRGTPVAEDQSALLEIAKKPPSEQPSAARRALRRKEEPKRKKKFVEPHPALNDIHSPVEPIADRSPEPRPILPEASIPAQLLGAVRNRSQLDRDLNLFAGLCEQFKALDEAVMILKVFRRGRPRPHGVGCDWRPGVRYAGRR
jgi:hypothetical protein